MATISPDSEIYILKNVPFDKSYNHTVKWSSATVQHNTLLGQNSSYVKYVLTSQSYQRWKRDYIRVDKTCDDLYDCNYLAFRNSTTGGKWFYAFLDEPEYINNNCSQLHYTIDVMQTWMFDFTVPPCFVEREHAISDAIGENVVSENVGIGEYVTNSYDHRINYSVMLGAIITSKKLPDVLYFDYNNIRYHLFLTPTFVPENLSTGAANKAPSGVPTGVYVYCGFPISANDVNEQFYSSYNQYNMQDFHIYDNYGNIDVSMTRNFPPTLQLVLSEIGNGILLPDLSSLSIDDVLDVYTYPAILNTKSYENNATGLSFKKGIGVSLPQYLSTIDRFDENGIITDTYTPVNNKMLTFPYIKIHINANNGSSHDYAFEDFKDLTQAFVIMGNYANKGSILFVPTSYRGIDYDIEESLSITDFPSPAYKGSQFASWLESNKWGALGGLVSSAITSLSIRNASPVGNNVLNLGTNIADMLNAPPKTAGDINADVFKVGANLIEFTIQYQNIKPQFARIIDEYFSVQGYASKRVKIPNVFNGSSTRRSQWNYLKTIGAHIKSTNNGIPAADIDMINKILDNGITFWYNISNVGNYALTNNIITG